MGEIFMIVPGNTFHKHMSRDLTEAYLLPLHSKSTISTVSTNVPLARHLGSKEDRRVCSYVLCLAFAHLHESLWDSLVPPRLTQDSLE